eukprot:602499-Prorocentrum_minimum.AAC.1
MRRGGAGREGVRRGSGGGLEGWGRTEQRVPECVPLCELLAILEHVVLPLEAPVVVVRLGVAHHKLLPRRALSLRAPAAERLRGRCGSEAAANPVGEKREAERGVETETRGFSRVLMCTIACCVTFTHAYFTGAERSVAPTHDFGEILSLPAHPLLTPLPLSSAIAVEVAARSAEQEPTNIQNAPLHVLHIGLTGLFLFVLPYNLRKRASRRRGQPAVIVSDRILALGPTWRRLTGGLLAGALEADPVVPVAQPLVQEGDGGAVPAHLPRAHGPVACPPRVPDRSLRRPRR